MMGSFFTKAAPTAVEFTASPGTEAENTITWKKQVAADLVRQMLAAELNAKEGPDIEELDRVLGFDPFGPWGLGLDQTELEVSSSDDEIQHSTETNLLRPRRGGVVRLRPWCKDGNVVSKSGAPQKRKAFLVKDSSNLGRQLFNLPSDSDSKQYLRRPGAQVIDYLDDNPTKAAKLLALAAERGDLRKAVTVDMPEEGVRVDQGSLPKDSPEGQYREYVRQLRVRQINQRRHAHQLTTNTVFEDMQDADHDRRDRAQRLKDLCSHFVEPTAMIVVHIPRIDDLKLNEEAFYDLSMDYAAVSAVFSVAGGSKSSPIIWIRSGMKKVAVSELLVLVRRMRTEENRFSKKKFGWLQVGHRMYFSVELGAKLASQKNVLRIVLLALRSSGKPVVMGGIEFHLWELIKRRAIFKPVPLKSR